MPDVSNFIARIRKQLVPNWGEGTSYPDMNENGDLCVAQGLPERAEITRLGNSWAKLTDEKVCLTAIPTTTAPHVLWSGEAAGGKSLIIDAIVWTCTTSAGAASQFALVALQTLLGSAAVPTTADTATKFSTLNGKSYSGKAATSKAVTVVDDGWFPIGASKDTALTTTVGQTIYVPVNGGIIVPPKGVLAVACIAVNATAAGKVAFIFHERQITNVLS